MARSCANYRSAVIVVGGVYADDVPKGDWQQCREADLVIGRSGTHQRRVIKDRFGSPRDIDEREWDGLYAAVQGEKTTIRVG